jgi:predicted 2-oxoglutarate/Fe(II)-dependent dioxygenase YbiX/peroxiredoxin
MSSGFTRGDRIPDFKRLNHAGEPQMLYDLQVGQPIVLLLFNKPDAEDTQAAIKTLGSDDKAWVQITRVALVRGTPAQCKHLLDSASIGFTLLADDGSVSAHLLGTEATKPHLITAFALDANFRVIERFEYAVGENSAEFLKQLMAVYQQAVPRDAQILQQQAPVLFVPRVFDESICHDLIAFFEQEGGQPSGTARIEGHRVKWQPDPSVKMRRDVYIKEGIWLGRIRDLLVRRLIPEIKRCFNFQVTQHEVFKLVCYDAATGGYFRPHRDNESIDTQHRRFAMTLNLNTGEYSGGQLRFPEFGPDLYQPERSGALVFSSSLLHEVIPVTSGKRYVLLGFFFGDAERMQTVEYVTPP